MNVLVFFIVIYRMWKELYGIYIRRLVYIIVVVLRFLLFFVYFLWSDRILIDVFVRY